ncbi:transposase family protein [Streptomyces sp. NPDC047000]|uniref:transposase family protein n=1 Tax=Streptomyces sp. NPDC047000 TaxID=3155474 RepID=UPI0033C23BE1
MDLCCRRGKRHPFVSVLLAACSSVVAGARSFAAIGQWARSAAQAALARLDARTVSVFRVRIAPSTATIRRIINQVCPGGLADLLGADPTGAGRLGPAPKEGKWRSASEFWKRTALSWTRSWQMEILTR